MSSFTINIIVTLLSKIFKIIISMVTLILIANMLGPEGQGIYKLSILFPSFLIMFGNFGIGNVIIYYYNNDLYDKRTVINSSLTISFAIAFFLFLVGFIIIILFRGILFPGLDFIHLFIGLISTPFLFLNSIFGAIFLANQNAKLYNLSRLINTFVFFIFILIFYSTNLLSTKNSIIGYTITSILSTIYLLTIYIKLGYNYCFVFNIQFIKNSLSYGIKIFLAGLANFFHYRIQMLIVNAMLSPSSLGVYSIATSLSEKTWVFSQSVGEMLFPKVASSNNQKDSILFTIQTFKITILLSLILSLVLYFISPFVINLLFDEAYYIAIKPFRILLVGTVAIAGWRILLNDLFGRNILTPIIFLSLFYTSLNIILNILLINKFRLIGAAYSSSITYVLLLVSTQVYYSITFRISPFQLINISHKDILFVLRHLYNLFYLRSFLNKF
jgi:O-antigen/teichoic acid export membrane protein